MLYRVIAALMDRTPEQQMTVVAELAVSLLEADSSALFLWEASSGRLVVSARSGRARDPGVAALDLADGSPSIRAAAGEHVLISAETEAPERGGQESESVVAVPLMMSPTDRGALVVVRDADRPGLTADHLTLASELAEQVGRALVLTRASEGHQRNELQLERSRIARDLHDSVIQRLYATGLAMQALGRADSARASDLDCHIGEIDAAITDIRTAIFALQPAGWGESTKHRVLELLTELAPHFKKRPRITFLGPVDLVVAGAIADDVLAVVREGLTNVIRHAAARTASVELAVTDSAVSVTIVDDGAGPTLPTHAGGGLANLQERARRYGGSFALTSAGPTGTRALWTAPLLLERVTS